MSPTKIQAIPTGMHTVTSPLLCENSADAIAFYIKAFNVIELARLPGPEGKIMHAQIVMLVDEMRGCGALSPKALNGSPVTLHLYVEDADAVFNRALAAGATVKFPMEDTFWGDRYGVLEDPFGHSWSIGTHLPDVRPEEMQQEIEKMYG